MARYFFDFRQNGTLAPDGDGCDFETVEDAYLGAFKAASEMWSGLLAQRQNPRRCYFEIHDGKGNLFFVLPFWEVLESCGNDRASKFSIVETINQSIAGVSRVRMAREEFLGEMEKSLEVLRQSKALIATPL